MLWSPLFLRDPGNIVAVRCNLLATSCLRLGLGIWSLAFGLESRSLKAKDQRPKPDALSLVPQDSTIASHCPTDLLVEMQSIKVLLGCRFLFQPGESSVFAP